MYFNVFVQFLGSLLFIFTASNALVDVTIDQTLLNSGFHPHLQTNITVYGNLTLCKLAVEEKFSKSLVVNNDELRDVLLYDVVVRINQKLDGEAVASEANPFSVYVYLNRSQPVVTSHEYHSQFLYILPVHVRYHDPQVGGGFREIKKEPAALFANCPPGLSLPTGAVVKFPCNPQSGSGICEWVSLSYSQKNLPLQSTIPVGDLEHHQIVVLSTHIIAYLGMIYVLHSLFSKQISL